MSSSGSKTEDANPATHARTGDLQARALEAASFKPGKRARTVRALDAALDRFNRERWVQRRQAEGGEL